MAKKNNTLLWVGGAAVLGVVLLSSKSSGGTNPITQMLDSLLPTPADTPAAVPTTYGVGVENPATDHEKVANLDVLIAADPRQGNPNYVLNPGEQSQYLLNYLDIRQGMPTWPGGINAANIQKHWKLFGPAQGRIFLPLQPPSGENYIPPPPAPKAKGHGFLKGLLEVVTVAAGVVVSVVSVGTAAPYVAIGVTAALKAESTIKGVNDPQTVVTLTPNEVELLVTSAYMIKKILPFYEKSNSSLVSSINDRVDLLVSAYE